MSKKQGRHIELPYLRKGERVLDSEYDEVGEVIEVRSSHRYLIDFPSRGESVQRSYKTLRRINED